MSFGCKLEKWTVGVVCGISSFVEKQPLEIKSERNQLSTGDRIDTATAKHADIIFSFISASTYLVSQGACVKVYHSLKVAGRQFENKWRSQLIFEPEQASKTSIFRTVVWIAPTVYLVKTLSMEFKF